VARPAVEQVVDLPGRQGPDLGGDEVLGPGGGEVLRGRALPEVAVQDEPVDGVPEAPPEAAPPEAPAPAS
jgi:hypothetical protein